MKIVIAVDSFKGSLTAAQACSALARGLEGPSRFHVVERPMADGGEGTAAAMISALNGERVGARVHGPLPGQEVAAGYGWLPATRTAVVEMAAASGLILVPVDQRNPLLTTTFGTGQLIEAAAGHGAERILLAVGGSGTVDGGAGAARALGWQFLDRRGQEIPLGGGALKDLRTVLPAAAAQVLPPIDVLCDVQSPLLGVEGAARLYAPQKGATPEMVRHLEEGLEQLARCCREQLGVQIGDLAGGGAAGGLAAGAHAFMGAGLTSGIDIVMAVCGLEDAIRDADWVVTGEGKFDHQSLRGKVVEGIARLARRHRTRIAVVAGIVDLPESEWRDVGIDAVLQTTPEGMTVEEAMTQGEHLLVQGAGRLKEIVSAPG